MKIFNQKNIKTYLTLPAAFLFPLHAFAQGTDVYDIFDIVIDISLRVIVITFVFIFVAFFWGLALFIKNLGGKEEALTQGKQWMFWSVVAIFVVVSLYGILGFLQRSTPFDSIIIPPLQER
ncbi:hypothetical protein L0Y49_02945 [bacterium]|nr:hypothetical protein [bacterium]